MMKEDKAPSEWSDFNRWLKTPLLDRSFSFLPLKSRLRFRQVCTHFRKYAEQVSELSLCFDPDDPTRIFRDNEEDTAEPTDPLMFEESDEEIDKSVSKLNGLFSIAGKHLAKNLESLQVELPQSWFLRPNLRSHLDAVSPTLPLRSLLLGLGTAPNPSILSETLTPLSSTLEHLALECFHLQDPTATFAPPGQAFETPPGEEPVYLSVREDGFRNAPGRPGDPRTSLIASLASLSRLRTLRLSFWRLSDEDVESLAASLPNLRDLDVASAPGEGYGGHLSSAACKAIAQGCPHLQMLDISYHEDVEFDGIQELLRLCVHLRELDISRCRASETEEAVSRVVDCSVLSGGSLLILKFEALDVESPVLRGTVINAPRLLLVDGLLHGVIKPADFRPPLLASSDKPDEREAFAAQTETLVLAERASVARRFGENGWEFMEEDGDEA
uniref:Uncharacterized protein n=1 Tax=Chromera velia CCMP2878 TaxID=1169474 RepID=A0A0G4GTX6_9ALVE|eukprot:Cvel_749.t1-p1 / transcript=Cvel_749.t1 / gene=Cvel_749 / organism=Chromera_velia_CCMP2878 / gene_product=hypothetical protein / transcript_product=hypothetical protein / location=Cvel_scaffold23:90641-92094(-) / protein_length=442 / sequence_SO=supercontig / SO=protein_coding / is_pseudo=false